MSKSKKRVRPSPPIMPLIRLGPFKIDLPPLTPNELAEIERAIDRHLLPDGADSLYSRIRRYVRFSCAYAIIPRWSEYVDRLERIIRLTQQLHQWCGFGPPKALRSGLLPIDYGIKSLLLEFNSKDDELEDISWSLKRLEKLSSRARELADNHNSVGKKSIIMARTVFAHDMLELASSLRLSMRLPRSAASVRTGFSESLYPLLALARRASDVAHSHAPIAIASSGMSQAEKARA